MLISFFVAASFLAVVPAHDLRATTTPRWQYPGATDSFGDANQQCLNIFINCLRYGPDNLNLLVQGQPTQDSRVTPTLFPNDQTPFASPKPIYADASSCGISGYIQNDSIATTIPRRQANELLNAMRQEFPWHVAVSRPGFRNADVRCSAVIIDPKWLLTAGNCAFAKTGEPITSVFNLYEYQAWSIDRPEPETSLIEIPAANRFTNDQNTLVLLKLDNALSLDSNWTVQQICLPRLLDMCRVGACEQGASAIATGWEDNRPASSFYGTLKRSLISIPGIQEFHPVLAQMDIGASVSSVRTNWPNEEKPRFTLCGLHSGGGLFYPICDDIAWMQQVIRQN